MNRRRTGPSVPGGRARRVRSGLLGAAAVAVGLAGALPAAGQVVRIGPGGYSTAFDRYADAPPTAGGSRANTYLWIAALKSLGRVDASVTADRPTAAVFRKGAARNYVAWNPTGRGRLVAFSDGQRLPVPSQNLAVRGPAAGAPRLEENR